MKIDELKPQNMYNSSHGNIKCIALLYITICSHPMAIFACYMLVGRETLLYI